MSTLSACIKKAGKAISQGDAAAITTIRDSLKADGMKAQEAAIEAVKMHIADLVAERVELAGDTVAPMNLPALENLNNPPPPAAPKDYPKESDFGFDPSFQEETAKTKAELRLVAAIDGKRAKFTRPQKEALWDYAKGRIGVDGTAEEKASYMAGLMGETGSGLMFKVGRQEAADIAKNLVSPAYLAARVRNGNKRPDQLSEAVLEEMDASEAMEDERDFNAYQDLLNDPTRFEKSDHPFADMGDFETDFFSENPNPNNSPVTLGKGVAEVSQKAADATLEEWKAEAERIGKEEDRSHQIVVSLFDTSGVMAQPWRDAGYTVIQKDIQQGNDIMLESPGVHEGDFPSNIDPKKARVVGIIAQPPCTTFTLTANRWFEQYHNKDDKMMVYKTFGHSLSAIKYEYTRAIDYASMMVAATELYLDFESPSFYVLENPAGSRLPALMGFAEPTVKLQPSDVGHPYTKETGLWGKFNTDMPTAKVNAVEGSKMQNKIWSTGEKGKGDRSLTPEGMAYSIFMANNQPNEVELDGRSIEDKYQEQEDVVFNEDLSDYNGSFKAAKKAPAKKTKKKPAMTKTQKNGSLKNVDKRISKAVMDTLARETPEESARILKNLEELNETPWAVTAIKGLAIREFMHLATEGKAESKEAQGILESDVWGKQAGDKMRRSSIIRAFTQGGRSVEALISSYENILTDNKKAEKSISTSMKNCDPSPECAKHCYDATGTGGNPNSIMKSEFLEWAAEFHPALMADRIEGQFRASALGGAGLALRLNDKGDLSESQVALTDEMARRGIRMQIFSKRPELLRRVNPFHLRMLSVDASNIEIAEANPDLQLAITLTDGMSDEMLLRIASRAAVVLPVNLKGNAWSMNKLRKQWPSSYKDFKKAICPVEAGMVEVVPKTSFVQLTANGKTAVRTTSGKRAWTCTTCDKLGTFGCFYGANQTTVARADLLGSDDPKEGARLATINQIRLELGKLEKIGGMTREQSKKILDEIIAGGGTLSANVDSPAAAGAGEEYSKGSGDDSGGGVQIQEGAGGAARVTRTTGLEADHVEQIAARLTANWKGAPDIKVIQAKGDLPLEIVAEMRKQGVDDIAGYFDRANKDIYLVADGINSNRDVQITLLHETVGHFGIEAVMGKTGINNFLKEVHSVKDSDPVVAEAYAYVEEHYEDAPEIIKASEVVAKISESNPKHNLVQRAIQMIRETLRKLGFTVPFTNSDIIEALRRAEQAIVTGETQEGAAEGVLFQAAYHGSKHRHNKFKLKNVGTGEGNAAYGWGLYFAQKKEIAEHYRSATSDGYSKTEEVLKKKMGGVFGILTSTDIRRISNNLWFQRYTPYQAVEDVLDRKLQRGDMTQANFDKVVAVAEEAAGADNSGQIYTVEVPENRDLLDYDAPLIEQREMLPLIKPALDYLGDIDIQAATGEIFYDRLARKLGSQEAASKYLKTLGIPGLRYFDDLSRNVEPDVPAFEGWAGYFKGEDLNAIDGNRMAELREEYDEFVDMEDTRTRNFVIFDDEQIEITNTLFKAVEQPDLFEGNAAEAAKLTKEEVAEWRAANKVSQRKGRVPEVEAAAKQLKAGEISKRSYDEIVTRYMPIMPIADVPELTSVKDMSAALATNKADSILGVDRTIKEGARVASRLDIPAYDFYNTWVVSLHDGSVKSGKSIAYGATAVMEDVEFNTNPKAALGIATGEMAKAPFARIHGNWNDVDPSDAHALAGEAMESNEWVQVGMNPFRHSYFYNKMNGRPVVKAAKVIQVGPLVMAKDPVYADPEDNKFQVGDSGITFRSKSNSGFGGEEMVESTWDWFVRKWQDKMRPLKLAQRDIEAAGGDINEDNDTYRGEEAFYGKAENDLVKMKETYLEPLVKFMAAAKISREDLDDFLYARHARERNEHIRNKINGMQDGGSGMTDQQSREVLAKFRALGQEADLLKASKYIYDMLQHQRDLKRNLQADEITDAWEAKFKYYVPLKGLSNDEESPRGTGRGFDIRGKESKKALGRKSKSESPLLHAIKDTTEAIIRVRKNEVGNTFLAMVRANPDPDYWQIFSDENPDMERREITTKKGPKIVNMPVAMHMQKDDYFATKKDGRVYYIKLADKRLIHAMQNLGPEPLNVVLRGMNTVTRVLSSLSTSYNPEFMISNMARDVQTAVLALMAEQDLPDGRASGQSIAVDMVASTPKAIRAIHASLWGKQLTGENAKWQKYFEEFKEDGAKTGWFDQKDIEGQASDLNTMLQKAQGGAMGTAHNAKDLIKDIVEHSNTAVENGVRLSVYRHAREAGVSRKQAASLAKNLTVNFNRKGEIGGALNSAYMFANASIQGTANFGRAMLTFKDVEKSAPVIGKKRLNVAQKAGAALVGGAYILSMLNRFVSDDDEDGVNWYDKVPRHVRERNIVLMKSLFGGPTNEYFTIPLPYGYNVFYNLGDSAEAAVNSDYRSMGQLGTGLATAMMGSFSPIGFEASDRTEVTIMKTLSPTVLSPIVQLGVNENFYGAPIYREDGPYDVPTPDSSRSKRSTKPHWAKIAKELNAAFGDGSEYRSGLIDISPDTIGHLFDFSTGSAGAFYSRTLGTTAKVATGQEVEDREIPFYRKVSGKVMPYEDQSRFYERRDELAQIDKEFKSLKSEARDDFRKKFNTELKLSFPMKAAEKKLANLRKLRKAAEASRGDEDAKAARLDKIQSKMDSVIDDFNRRYNKATSSD